MNYVVVYRIVALFQMAIQMSNSIVRLQAEALYATMSGRYADGVKVGIFFH